MMTHRAFLWSMIGLSLAGFGGTRFLAGRADATHESTRIILDVRQNVPQPIAHDVELTAGQTVEISARVLHPSRLPANGRLLAEWELADSPTPELIPRGPEAETDSPRALDELGIDTPPTPNWSKVLHALDGDTYVVYRAPVAGTYRLTVAPLTEKTALFEGERWREAGAAPEIVPTPSQVHWPDDAQVVEVAARVRTLDIAGEAEAGMFIEAEPNDTPEQAQPIAMRQTNDDHIIHIVGGADDIEYFDNGKFGECGDDWFRLEFKGTEPRMLSACLSIPDQQVVAQVRCYVLDADQANVTPGALLPLTKEYEDGKNPNERVHQQNEQYRVAINRNLEPGKVYFLRVEANGPGYDLELRIVRPAPFDDPRHAVRHALYDHIGQVNSWLMNRPRGAAVDRRIRDTGNLMGTMCMSCHTQSGVWGPAIPFAQGYRAQNAQLMRELTNICYQSMRPTNELIDAANNTSLAPLDLGDGPAGTRVAGHAVVSLERFKAPRKLHGKQAIRAANFVLQSGDPGGINAAGPGANVGQGVVFNYAGEILYEAWKATGDPKYFRGLEDKARRMLDINVKYCDDLGHRVEFFHRYFPQDYVAHAAAVAQKEKEQPAATHRVPYDGHKTTPDEAVALEKRIREQVAADLQRLRQIQKDDGSWGFNPGQSDDDGKWKVTVPNDPDPSPTAMALIAFQAAGFEPDDETVAKGVKALLKMQHPTGYWNAASQTGFVSTSYSMHALSRLFPAEPPIFDRERFELNAIPGGRSKLIATLKIVRELSMIEEPRLLDVARRETANDSPLVRFYAMMALGSTPRDESIAALASGLGDDAKMVREAAHWGFRQCLIDDRGWDAIGEAMTSDYDYVRQAAAQALLMRVDSVMPEAQVDLASVGKWLSHGMNDDPHPAVRAWAMRAAWNWWVWNPPIRPAINEAWVKLFSRPEPNALAENAMRYQSHALFIANGHRANVSSEHQYTELKTLFADLKTKMEAMQASDPEAHRRIVRRVVASAATFYNTAGGDGGPGQMGYVTPGQGDLFGSAILLYLKSLGPGETADATLLQSALEGAANIPHRELQQTLIDYSLNGPEDLRPIAASSVSDPRSAQLVAVSELLEPLLKQIERGANEPDRRPQLSDPVLKMFARVKWVVPDTLEQQREIFTYLVPEMTKYSSSDEIANHPDPAEKARLEREMESAWYLVRGLGDAVGNNPDLHIDPAIERFPEEFQNPLAIRYWLPSVEWILTYKTMLPEVKVEEGQASPIDPLEQMRTRVLLFFIDQLKESAHPENRELAVRQAQATALRRNPEVLTALDQLVTFEKREKVVEMAKNVLATGRENFVNDLKEAVKNENPPRFEVSPQGEVNLPDEFVRDFEYFRDYVSPEMNRVLRSDQRSCFACHGVPGRVPPLTLKNPDDVGYLPVSDLLENYRLLQGRIDLDDIEKSKLLRKPLNVQTGKEDGHQGGRRYQPDDPGYQILRTWVLNQGKNHEQLGFAPLDSTAGKN